MSTYEVSPDSLRALAGRLEGIRAELAGTGAVIGGYAGLLGSPDVDWALDEFFRNWSDGMNKIEGHLDGVVERLRAAADVYVQTDLQIAQAATPSGSGSSSAT
jgi:uncharacterized protein YukE